MPEPRSLGIVVVNYASADLLAVNLAATAAAVPDAQVIVVDNRSTDADRARVAALTRAHGWRLVAMDDNAGFGG